MAAIKTHETFTLIDDEMETEKRQHWENNARQIYTSSGDDTDWTKSWPSRVMVVASYLLSTWPTRHHYVPCCPRLVFPPAVFSLLCSFLLTLSLCLSLLLSLLLPTPPSSTPALSVFTLGPRFEPLRFPVSPRESHHCVKFPAAPRRSRHPPQNQLPLLSRCDVSSMVEARSTYQETL